MSNLAPGDAIPAASLDQRLVVDRDSQRVWSREFVELLVLQFVFGLGFSVFHLLPKYLRTEYHASGSEIGLATGIGVLAAVAATPLIAIWIGRGARRAPARIALFVLAASSMAFTQVRAVGPYMLGLRVAQGVAAALFMSITATRGAELAPPARLAQAIGWVGLAALVTNALAPLLAEPIAVHYGWPWVFMSAAACGLVGLVMAGRLSDPAPVSSRAARQFFLAQRSVLTVLYATVVCGAALGVLFTYTQPLVLGRGARDVGRFFSGYVFGAAAVRLLLSTLADRMGRGRVSRVTLVFYAAIIGATTLVTPGALLWAGVGVGVSHGVLYPALNAMALERATDRNRGTLAAVFGGAFNLGFSASILGLGVVVDTFGYATVFIGTAVLTLTGAVALSSVE